MPQDWVVNTAEIRLHGRLELSMVPSRRGARVQVAAQAHRTVKDAIEALGPPHTEIDLILADGRPVGLDHRLAAGECLDVFGIDRPGELTALPGLMPAAPDPRRFILDGHLGRLAGYLRMLGFDATYDPAAVDADLASLSVREGRILLTRDRGLLKRSSVRHGYLVRADDPRDQLFDVAARYELASRAAPFTRCIRCNGLLESADPAEVAVRLAGEPRTLKYFDRFSRCSACGAIYWQGSHFDRMSLLVAEVRTAAAVSGDAGLLAGSADAAEGAVE
jgi:uncharacterized protein with PIN domain